MNLNLKMDKFSEILKLNPFSKNRQPQWVQSCASKKHQDSTKGPCFHTRSWRKLTASTQTPWVRDPLAPCTGVSISRMRSRGWPLRLLIRMVCRRSRSNRYTAKLSSYRAWTTKILWTTTRLTRIVGLFICAWSYVTGVSSLRMPWILSLLVRSRKSRKLFMICWVHSATSILEV